MFAAVDTATGQVWICGNGRAKVVRDLDALHWSGPIRMSGSMRFLIALLGYKVVQ